MEGEDKELSNVSDEDFTNLDSSSPSSDGDNSEQGSDEESEHSTQAESKGKKNSNKSKKPPVKKKKVVRPKIVMNVSDTQYDVVKYVGKKLFGWKLSYETETFDWDIMWTDNAVQPETLAKMQTYQKINHFPGMYSLARKNHLGRHLMRMKKAFPENYKFFPQTFLLPSEYNDFKAQFSKKKNKTFIVKPEASCQGRGIFLTRTWESIQPGEHYVVQRYLHKPLLIDNLKFDMRVYVLLAGCDPLKIFLYDDGLGRFCTEEYIAPTGENLDNVCMHLTNYAINKDNPNFVFNESSNADDVGHKRSLKAVMKMLEAQGHDVKALWSDIRKIIIKTFCSVQPILAHSYKSCHPDEPYNNMCFELLGFDIMLDHKLKPWLIEVNHTPSFTTDTPLDKSIKKSAIRDALKLMNITMENKNKVKNKKRAELQQRVLTGKKVKVTPEEKQAASENAQRERNVWEGKNCGRYTKIYPFDDPEEADEDYEEYIRVAHKWWEEWTGTSVKKNVKKVADPNKPPPMVFGGTSVLANRAKDIQSIYSQKLKTPNPKPPSGQNPRPIPDAQTRNPAIKPEKWEENEEMEVDDRYFDEENQDFMEHVAALTGKAGPFDVIAEDQEEYYDILHKNPQNSRGFGSLPPTTTASQAKLIGRPFEERTIDSEYEQKPRPVNGSAAESRAPIKATGTGTSFRIKTLPYSVPKESPQKAFADQNNEDQQKFHFSRKFAHYITPEKLENMQATETGKNVKNSGPREKEAASKKVPLKLANGVIGVFQSSNEDGMWSDSGAPQGIRSLDIERGVKASSNLLQKGNARDQKFLSKKSQMGGYMQTRNSGNYIAPKLFELDISSGGGGSGSGSGAREEAPIRSRENIASGGASSQYQQPQFVSGSKATGKSILHAQKETMALLNNLNYFNDSSASIQRYYQFLTHGKK